MSLVQFKQIFREDFLSTLNVVSNGGKITSKPTITGGIVSFDGTDDKIQYPPKYNIKTVFFDLYAETTTEQVMQFNATQSIVVNAGTLTATGFSSPTLYLDGSASSTVAAQTWYRVAITTSTAFDADDFSIGNISTNFGQVKLKNLSISQNSITSLDAQNDYNNQNFNFINKAVAYWPMHDKVGTSAPFTTSDLIQNNNLELGDGTTSTTFPTKIVGRNGYTFDGGDYLKNSTASFPEGTEARTVAVWAKRTTTSGGALCAFNTTSGQKFILLDQVLIGSNFVFTDGLNGANNITVTNAQRASLYSKSLHIITMGTSNDWSYYIDGELVKSGTFPIAINTPTVTSVTFGQRLDLTAFYTGNIYSAYVFDFKISSTQAKYLYLKDSHYLGNL